MQNLSSQELIGKLQDLLGPAGFLDGQKASERKTSFWNSDPLRALALVRPQNTHEVSAILRLCHEHKQSVRIIGGGTGPVGGAEPDFQTLALSLERMNAIERVDPVDGVCVAQAGAVLQSVQESAAAQNLLFPLDLGARGSCTIGGNISTNAGGINVLRYGSTRSLVLGMEVVLADGTIVSAMNTLLKNNAGYDLKQLFIGAEGTIGVVTRAALRLFPKPSSRQTALMAMSGFEDVIAFLAFVRQNLGGNISAFEVMWSNYFEQQVQYRDKPRPFEQRYSHYVMLECEGSEPLRDGADFEAALTSAFEVGLLKDAIIAKSDKERKDLWNLREDLDAVLSGEKPYGYDVGVPISAMASYVERVEKGVASRWPKAECLAMGHIADGNIHFFIKPGQPGTSKEECDEEVYGPLREISGTISAEHGIGFEKRDWLTRTRSAEELAMMHSLKKTFDPREILNPQTVFRS